MSTRNLRLLFAVAAVVAAPAFAQTTHTSDYTFPLVGLAGTETLGVNLINLAPKSENGTAASCTGTVTFINSAGTTVGTSTFTLATDAATSATLAGAGTGAARLLIRTVVATTTTSNEVPCSLSFSLNTYDTTSGVTHLFLTGSSPSPTPGH